MPTVDESRSLLSAGASYNAGDWASVGAETSLEMLAVADLNRGVDIGVGIEALASLDGAIRQYLAADINGRAHAAARVRAQVQMPMDLFGEAGLAIRLQAIAEAAAGVELAIGLDIGSFLALAGEDPRLKGVPFELLKIFLDEFSIQGGVMAKAAASAMAYANLVATGSFIKSGNRQPGFTIAAEAGVGLKAGAGFRVLVRFGVDDPRRLVRRTIDVAVDETLRLIATLLPPDQRPLAMQASAPLKIGLRSAFELGAALAENGGAYASGDRGTLALRICQVSLEEMQRVVLERAVAYASGQLRLALRDLPFDNSAWNSAQTQRQALAARLSSLPDEPFEATTANRSYWSGVISDVVGVTTALGGQPTGAVADQLSLIWCGVQLLMKSVERISFAQARVSVVGASPVGTTAAFDGSLPDAPGAVRTHINTVLGRRSDAVIRQQQAMQYVLSAFGTRLDEIAPEVAGLLRALTGQTTAPAAAALGVVFSNLGAFVPGPDGTVNAESTLLVLRTGLREYVTTRIDAELLPLVIRATSDNPELHVYLEEVLLDTLRTVIDTVFDAMSDWSSGSASTHRALRELCSSLLMRLFGRSLVVTGDVLMAHALGQVRGEFLQLAANADMPGGIVPTLAGLTRLDRDALADLVEETLEVCADIFSPMPADRRARMRDLMYQMIDTMPPGSGANTLEALRSTAIVGNAEAAFELAQLLGEEIAGNVIRFVQALLTRIAATLLALLQDVIEEIQAAVDSWIEGIEVLVSELLDTLADLLRTIGELEQRIDDATDAWLGYASELLGGFVEASGNRSKLRDKIKKAVIDRALDALAEFPGYDLLPYLARKEIRATVRRMVGNGVNDAVFDPVVDVLRAVSSETAELLDDLRAIEPGDNLAEAIADVALDRIEDAVRDAFGSNPVVRIRFDAPLLGEVDLGRVSVPIGNFVSVLRSVVRSLSSFDDAVGNAAGALAELLNIEAELAAREDEHHAATATKAEADDRVAEVRRGATDLYISHPQAGSALTGAVTLRLRVPGGTPSMLNSEGLSHRRLFVWVNGEELMLDGAEVMTEQTVDLSASLGSSLALASSGSPRRVGHPAVAARVIRHDAARADRVPSAIHAQLGKSIRGRLNGTGSAHRFGGVTLTPVAARGAFPPRVPSADLSGLVISRLAHDHILVVAIDVPAALLHEGINAIACTLVPGATQRRVERAVSFLYTPATSDGFKGRGPVMPPTRITNDLPEQLISVFRARGLKLQVAAPVKTKGQQVRESTWVLPKATRARNIAEGRGRLTEELQKVAAAQKSVRQAVKSGALRPRVVTLNDTPTRSSGAHNKETAI